MNNYKEKYEILTKDIEDRKEVLKGLKESLREANSKNFDKYNELRIENLELDELEKNRHKIATSKDKYIEWPIIALELIIICIMGYIGVNIAIIPSNILLKILVGLLTLSLGGSLSLGIVIMASIIVKKLKRKVHKKIVKTNSEYKKLSKDIYKKKIIIKQKAEEKAVIDSNIRSIADRIREEESAIRIDAQELEQLRKEIIRTVLDTDSIVEEVSRPYTRLKTKEEN